MAWFRQSIIWGLLPVYTIPSLLYSKDNHVILYFVFVLHALLILQLAINALFGWLLFSLLIPRLSVFVLAVQLVLGMAASHVPRAKVSDRFAVSYNLPWHSKYTGVVKYLNCGTSRRQRTRNMIISNVVNVIALKLSLEPWRNIPWLCKFQIKTIVKHNIHVGRKNLGRGFVMSVYGYGRGGGGRTDLVFFGFGCVCKTGKLKMKVSSD